MMSKYGFYFFIYVLFFWANLHSRSLKIQNFIICNLGQKKGKVLVFLFVNNKLFKRKREVMDGVAYGSYNFWNLVRMGSMVWEKNKEQNPHYPLNFLAWSKMLNNVYRIIKKTLKSVVKYFLKIYLCVS
jgi:hypothetical protein